jgi:CheY-like chemotaxis protein
MTERLSVLIVEDEPLIAMMIEDFVDLLEHDVAGTFDTVGAAVERISAGGFDVAIIDVNLRDGPCWPAADALAAAGKPFVIATGGFVEPPPAQHAAVRQLAKPFTLEGVRNALEEMARA